MAKKLDSIQILRAIAAISVVAVHSIDRAARTFPLEAPHSFFARFPDLSRLGTAGVDIFFVISGFVMMYVHYEQFGEPAAPSRFLVRRIVRVVPLYWILTGVAVVSLAVAPKLFFFHSTVDLPWVIGSFLFLQIAPHSGPASPVIGQGWTLDFEMFFYAIFAITLFVKRRFAIPLLALIFGIFLAIGLVFPNRPLWLTVWTGPLLTEFLAGVALAIAYRRAMPIFNRRIGYLVITLGVALFAASVWNSPPWKSWYQPLEWGIPATLIVWGTLSLKVKESWRVSFGKLLGDASYSIYLFQVFALPGLALLLKAGLRGHGMPVDLAACILVCASVAVSVGCWYLLERPITRFLNTSLRKWETASPLSAIK